MNKVDELITKKQAIKIILSHCSKVKTIRDLVYYTKGLEKACELLNDMRPELKIIKCKYCIYRAIDIDDELYCRKNNFNIEDEENSFCSWAENDGAADDFN